MKTHTVQQALRTRLGLAPWRVDQHRLHQVLEQSLNPRATAKSSFLEYVLVLVAASTGLARHCRASGWYSLQSLMKRNWSRSMRMANLRFYAVARR